MTSVGLAAGLVCLVWAAGLTVWFGWWLALRTGRKRRFVKRAAACGFMSEEAQSLWLLGRFAGSPDRLGIIQSLEVFDRCVLQAKKTAGDDLLSWPELLTASRIGALRRKYTLGSPRSRHSFTSTREIEINQPVQVVTKDGGVFESFILHATEEGIHLASPPEPELKNNIKVGADVTVSFWRLHDARYEVCSKILGNGARLRQTFLVAHADLRRVQERGFVRVRCKNTLRFVPCKESETKALAERNQFPESCQTGMLKDLSIGGASFVCDTDLSAGSWLLMQVHVEPDPDPLTLAARVVRQERLDGTSRAVFLTSASFHNLRGRKDRRLGRFVSKIQQGLIRRMLLRVGGPGGVELPFPSADTLEEKISVKAEMRADHMSDRKASALLTQRPEPIADNGPRRSGAGERGENRPSLASAAGIRGSYSKVNGR